MLDREDCGLTSKFDDCSPIFLSIAFTALVCAFALAGLVVLSVFFDLLVKDFCSDFDLDPPLFTLETGSLSSPAFLFIARAFAAVFLVE